MAEWRCAALLPYGGRHRGAPAVAARRWRRAAVRGWRVGGRPPRRARALAVLAVVFPCPTAACPGGWRVPPPPPTGCGRGADVPARRPRGALPPPTGSAHTSAPTGRASPVQYVHCCSPAGPSPRPPHPPLPCRFRRPPRQARPRRRRRPPPPLRQPPPPLPPPPPAPACTSAGGWHTRRAPRAPPRARGCHSQRGGQSRSPATRRPRRASARRASPLPPPTRAPPPRSGRRRP
ncbi:hypothetical protein I4F81_006107 [Pyropia yezoensis]|uniref:Uncharacterized protein n=1 Tax=Pyropia yezoensis TaxID=2788 RepID=A0ACC3C1A5_PYRYE|nr:hypothetical protein I4F81_006107 [Neopyropia yezoensis]